MQKIINESLYIKDCRWLSDIKISELRNFSTFAVAEVKGEPQMALSGTLCGGNDRNALPVMYLLPGISAEQLGDPAFKEEYGVSYSYYAGGMANAISSVDMVIALGKAGFMCSYGAGGISLSDIGKAIDKINSALPNKNYLVNCLSGNNPAYEMSLIKLLIEKGVTAIEASAFIELSPALIYYKLSGLKRLPNGEICGARRIIGKLSREEVATRFMSPPSRGIVEVLLREKLITSEQAKMAAGIPVADDITVEADSGGHTDNRPLVSLFPAISSLRDRMQKKYKYSKKIRVGAAGGISTPESTLAAFQMGAAYVVTGSVNQSCVEAGTSNYVKETLAKVTMADVVMAPCADMFELGARVQVIKTGTMFPMNAQRLYDLYIKNKSIDDLKDSEIKRLEKIYFKCTVDEIWKEVCNFFEKVDKKQIALAEKNGKIKMAMIFRWYLGKSSKWAIDGDTDRQMDMQIWCGQSMGAFNTWCQGTYLEKPENRFVVDIAKRIMEGAAYINLKNTAGAAGVSAESFPALQI